MVLPFQDGQDGRSANLSVFFFAALMSSEFWHCWQSHPLSSRNAVFQMAWLAGKQNCAGVVEGFFCTLETCKTMGSLLRNDWCWRLLDALGVHNFWKPLVAPVAWCCLMSDVDANKISLMLIREYHFLSHASALDPSRFWLIPTFTLRTGYFVMLYIYMYIDNIYLHTYMLVYIVYIYISNGNHCHILGRLKSLNSPNAHNIP